MDLKEAIYGRRSIRRYKEDPISDEDIQEILEAGMMAPSGEDRQPWYFVVVKSKEAMQEVVDLMSGKADVLLPSLQEKFAKYPEIVEETRKFIGLLGKAPICILVFQYQESSPAAERTVVQSVSAAIENMLLMAYAKGIGSCWLTAPLDTGADAIFKERYAPDKGNMVALLTFGYPEKEGRMTRRRTGRYTII